MTRHDAEIAELEAMNYARRRNEELERIQKNSAKKAKRQKEEFKRIQANLGNDGKGQSETTDTKGCKTAKSWKEESFKNRDGKVEACPKGDVKKKLTINDFIASEFYGCKPPQFPDFVDWKLLRDKKMAYTKRMKTYFREYHRKY